LHEKLGKIPEGEGGAPPAISVVIPVFNGTGTLRACLESVYRSAFTDFEVIVVDDGSVDGTAEVAASFPCTLLQLTQNSGAAAARNLGAAESRGGILFFLDADIVIRPQTLGMIAEALARQPDVDALFGSYTKHCGSSGFFSSYKNLVHYYAHQTSEPEAVTFCSGFGAVRRQVFFSLGGFDPSRRMLEDIELGHRMYLRGYRVLLYKDLQVTHCKHYTLPGMVRSDLMGRAIPWTRLILETGVFRRDLNLQWHNLLSVPLAYGILISPVLFHSSRLTPLAAALPVLFVALNRRFLALARQQQGLLFAARSCLMTWFSYLYSGLGVALGVAGHLRDRWRATLALPHSPKP
jgi:glycosyltransferase involved in cell wall biosynthesis